MVSELKELTNALTTPEMQREIQELKKECARYTERLKNIKAATNHVTPEEKEKVSREAAGCCAGLQGHNGAQTSMFLPFRCSETDRSTVESGGSGREW